MQQISPELVLVDPELAAAERPREWTVNVPVRNVVPLGVPLEPPRRRRFGRTAVALAGLSLLASGLAVSFLLFQESSGNPSRPSTVATVAPLSPSQAGLRSRDLRFQTKTTP